MKFLPPHLVLGHFCLHLSTLTVLLLNSSCPKVVCCPCLDKTILHEWKVLLRSLRRPGQHDRPGKQSLRYHAFHRVWYPFCNQTDILNPCTQWLVRYPSLYKIRAYQHNLFHLSCYYASQITWLWFPPHRRPLSSWPLKVLIRNQMPDRAWCSSRRWCFGA